MPSLTTSYIVAPESRVYVVVVNQKIKTITVATEAKALELSAYYRDLGMDVLIYEEWDLIESRPLSQLLLPLEAESTKKPKLC